MVYGIILSSINFQGGAALNGAHYATWDHWLAPIWQNDNF
jgi:hypothetical protein